MKIGTAVARFEIKFEMLLENWDNKQLDEFREYAGIYPDIEVAGKQVRKRDDVRIDYHLPVLHTRKYPNYLLSKLMIQGLSFKEIIKRAVVEPTVYRNVKNHYTRAVFKFVSADGQVLHGKTLAELCRRITSAGIRDIKTSTARTKIERGGEYTYYGTYIGTFSKQVYVRRVVMEDAEHKQLTKEWW